MSELDDLLSSLSPPQQSAIRILRLSLNCFNSAEGSGLFSGMARYSVLAGRVEICAVQADSLPKFWALLLRRMQWEVPAKAWDEELLHCLSMGMDREVLQVLATETASVVTLARMAHDGDKAIRKANRAEGIVSARGAPFNDSLEGIGG